MEETFDSDNDFMIKIDKLAELVKQAKHCIVSGFRCFFLILSFSPNPYFNSNFIVLKIFEIFFGFLLKIFDIRKANANLTCESLFVRLGLTWKIAKFQFETFFLNFLQNFKNLSKVYTGAGISTAANIPDYRGADGVWTSIQNGDEIKKCNLTTAEPTYSHMALCKLVQSGNVKYILSQNCDGLHIRSGIPENQLSGNSCDFFSDYG